MEGPVTKTNPIQLGLNSVFTDTEELIHGRAPEWQFVMYFYFMLPPRLKPSYNYTESLPERSTTNRLETGCVTYCVTKLVTIDREW